jgi:hypothetical protein
VTGWLKLSGPVTVTAALVPDGSPLMVTASAPVVAAHATAYAAVTVSPAGMVTVRGLSPCTLQLAARPPRSTPCGPGSSPWMVTLALVPTALGAPLSTATV